MLQALRSGTRGSADPESSEGVSERVGQRTRLDAEIGLELWSLGRVVGESDADDSNPRKVRGPPYDLGEGGARETGKLQPDEYERGRLAEDLEDRLSSVSGPLRLDPPAIEVRLELLCGHGIRLG